MTHENHFADCCVDAQRASTRERHKDRHKERRATNGVDERRLDDLVQRKRVGIHDGHCGNKVDGLFGLNKLNKSISRTAGWGLKTNKETTNKTSGEAKQMKRVALGC